MESNLCWVFSAELTVCTYLYMKSPEMGNQGQPPNIYNEDCLIDLEFDEHPSHHLAAATISSWE